MDRTACLDELTIKALCKDSLMTVKESFLGVNLGVP